MRPTGAEAMALWRVAVRAAPQSIMALKMAANAAAVAASLRTFMTGSFWVDTRHMIHHVRNQGARRDVPDVPDSPVDKYASPPRWPISCVVPCARAHIASVE